METDRHNQRTSLGLNPHRPSGRVFLSRPVAAGPVEEGRRAGPAWARGNASAPRDPPIGGPWTSHTTGRRTWWVTRREPAFRPDWGVPKAMAEHVAAADMTITPVGTLQYRAVG